MKKYITLENNIYEAHLIIDIEKINDETLPYNRKTGTGADKNLFVVGAKFYDTLKQFFPLVLKDRDEKKTGRNSPKIKSYFQYTSLLNDIDFINNEIDLHFPKENKIDFDSYFKKCKALSTKQKLNSSIFLESEIANAQNGIAFKNWDDNFKEIIKEILLPTSQLKVFLFKDSKNETCAFWEFKQEYISKSKTQPSSITKEKSHQLIFFGSPGTGKSREVENRTNGHNRTRTTFHPETDYHSFVGSYKPVMDDDKIKYDFVPQAFTKAYCNAWKNLDKPHFLIIEEINRGNCAQIFGDIFQCLDRDDDGFSKYEIEVSKELATHLKKVLLNEVDLDFYNEKTKSTNEDFNSIKLPSNLFIYATMNTSDQSLFPMDSAFKRRWDWEFVPVDYEDAKTLTIEIDIEKYNWGNFIEIINPKIKELTGSEDKQLGNRFVNPNDGKITFDQLRSKVLFYMWSEVYKDEYGTQNSIFKYEQEGEVIDFQFGDLYNDNSEDLVKAFLKYNGIEAE